MPELAPIQIDKHGFPLLLAAPVKPALVKDPPPPTATSATTATKSKPAAVDPLEWDRRQDAVRSAAREFETFNEQDVAEHLKGKTTRPLSPVEAKQFAADVRAHTVTDLIDVLDQNERGLLRGRRMVRINAPRGYVRKTMNGLHAGEIDQVKQRLKARGWTAEQVKKLDGQFPESPAPAPPAVALSESHAPTEHFVQIAPPAVRELKIKRNAQGLIDTVEASHSSSDEDVSSHMAEILAAIPAPVINIAPAPVRALKVKRNAQGLINSVEVSSDAG